MGLVRGLVLLCFSVMWLFLLLRATGAQSPTSPTSNSMFSNARALDALLQDYAYQAFVRPRTGVVYDGAVPSNLSGIQVSAMRLRSGSLRTKGVRMYKEFEIPKGVKEHPYVERLVLVYQNLGNWSMVYYPLPGYMYLSPVLGLLAYDAGNLMAKNLPTLDIVASNQPISIKFSELKSVPEGSVPKCASFDLNGSVSFSSVLSDNICTTFNQGHFSIAVESIAPAPAPFFSAPPPSPRVISGTPEQRQGGNNSKVWIIVGSVVGGFALLIILGLLIVLLAKYKRRKKMHQMERAAEVGEALPMTTVGSTKAPAATGTRTQPMLETEYVP
ncbi:hypothetical protein F511_22801 [Dorcoceras hygrometricum]|uniref:Uncharacterized protein n=1 Tax=Dorcoceras hygrometricum TaxID=472368 RepID=A0A2Z7C211_9LAMI|nr:hypothetical protein F511_22801 [Dorcoceras hygrometricum]